MTNQEFDPKTLEPKGVQHDSETPVPQKPSFLFLVSTSLGVLVILLLAFSAYNGMAR